MTWFLWFHDPNNADYSESSYTPIMKVESVDDLWSLLKAIPLSSWNTGMFFFMREGYRPLWDVPENDKGGAWSKKVDAADTYKVLEDCIVHCFADKMLKQNNDCVVGVSVSPKGQFHIIKIWNNTTAINDRRLFSQSLKMKIGSDIAYKAHNLRPK